MKATLETRQLGARLDNDNVKWRVDRQARAIIIASLSNSPFRVIQDCQSIKLTWDKLQC